jgi:hypothetical protein
LADDRSHVSLWRLALALLGAVVFAALCVPAASILVQAVIAALGGTPLPAISGQLAAQVLFVAVYGSAVIGVVAIPLALPLTYLLFVFGLVSSWTVTMLGAGIALFGSVAFSLLLTCSEGGSAARGGSGGQLVETCRDGQLTLAGWSDLASQSLYMVVIGAVAALVGLGLYRLMGGKGGTRVTHG